MKYLTHRKAKALVKEEKAASKEYKSYGFTKIAKDEAKHAKIIKGYTK